MKTVFLNPFLPTDLNEKVTSVSFKIGSFDYIAKHANVKTTEIDFDKRIIQINDALDSEVSYQSTQGIQYGVSDHVLGLIYIILRDRSKDIFSSIRTQTFWHEHVHCLFVQANEDYANDIEYVVDAYATQICEFMRQFSKIKN